jgi:hypothetical protein
MAWSHSEIELLAKRMESRQGGFRVSAKTAPLVVLALRHYAREGLVAPLSGFQIDVWSPGMTQLVEHIALVRNLEVAHVAYQASVAALAPLSVTLRRGATLMRSSESSAVPKAP